MSAQILNLDDLAVPSKIVTLDGVQHTGVEMTVELYVKRLQKAKELERQNDNPNSEVSQEQKINDAVDFLNDMFPTIGSDRFRKMSMKQLSVLITYAMAAPEDIANNVAAANEEAEKNV